MKTTIYWILLPIVYTIGISFGLIKNDYHNMHISRIDHEMVYSDNKIWVLSGATFKEGKFSLCNNMEFFDFHKGEWTLINEFAVPRFSFEALPAKNSFYIIGGRDKNDSILNDLRLYDIKENSWKILSPMKIARDKHAAIQIKNKIYVVGGRAGKAPFTMEVYDINHNTWTIISEFKVPHHPVGAATDGRYIYLLSDTISKYMTGKIVLERYDPLTSEWINLPDLPTPRCDAPVVLIKGWIVVLGGWTPHGNIAKTEAFDLKKEIWVGLTDMKNPCQFHEAVPHMGNILITGGCLKLPSAEDWVMNYTPIINH